MNFNFDYISLPLKVNYRTGGKFFFVACIGICPAYLVKTSLSFPVLDSNGNQTGTKKENYKSSLSDYSFGILLELGLGYKISNSLEAIASLRYLHDITSSHNEDAYILMGLRYKFTKAI